MKIFFYYLMELLPICSSAQDRTGYDTLRLTWRAKNSLDACGGCSDNQYFFKFTYQDGKTTQEDYCLFTNMNFPGSIIKIFPVSNKIVKIEWRGHKRTKAFIGCGETTNSNAPFNDNHSTIDYLDPCYSYHSNNPWGGYVLQSPSFVDIKVSPSIKLFSPIDLVFPSKDNIDLKASSGLAPAAYNWQYNIGKSAIWYSFPAQYIGLDSINLSASQLLKASGIIAEDSVEQNLRVRVSSCNDTFLSDAVTYVIKKSPPKITSFSVTPPQCFDTDDGHISFTFDRALQTGETLILNLRDLNRTSLIYQVQIGDNDLDNTHTYKFLNNFQPSRYQLIYYGRYKFSNGSGTPVTSESNVKQSSEFLVVAPLPISFTTSQVNIWCYDGNDGSITINATGGTGNYQYMVKRSGQPDSLWYPFSTINQQIITGLRANTWLVQVRDGSNCYAKSGAGGTIITQSLTLTQPASPLQNSLDQLVNPKGYGLSDGTIEVTVNGGTPNTDGSYNFQFTKADGTPINAGITTTATGGGYDIKISNLPDGKYILTSNDNNYGSATAKNGCTATNTYTLVQPMPLIVKMQIQDSILCKGNTNGSLVAHASGGIPFTTGNPYYYNWKKQNSGGTYTAMPFQTDSIATLLATGWYAVNIQDANGIVLAQDSMFFLPEPTELTVSTSQINVTCSGLPDGSAGALASGGTPPYNYQ